ncbi:uncharacterized protein G2W53_020543 [Senna tora]|uniref:Uncharacterized protein n=1 Tax=Senna tora TaxID=362788 RepID=A0A834U3A2_9FABA|nr:uncharacterized protein G2W53_020543 [Senna tora]
MLWSFQILSLAFFAFFVFLVSNCSSNDSLLLISRFEFVDFARIPPPFSSSLRVLFAIIALRFDMTKEDDNTFVWKVTPSSNPSVRVSRVSASEVVSLEEREVSSTAAFEVDLAELDWEYERRNDVPIERDDDIPSFAFMPDSAKEFTSWSDTHGVACGDKGSVRIMSLDGTRFLMYSFVFMPLDIKPHLTPFEMNVLHCLNLCLTQLTGNAWALLCGFQLQCYRLQESLVRVVPLKGVHPFWLDEGNRQLFSLTWSKASSLPIVDRESLSLGEIKIVDRMSERLERVKNLKYHISKVDKAREFALWRLAAAPSATEGGSSKSVPSASLPSLT